MNVRGSREVLDCGLCTGITLRSWPLIYTYMEEALTLNPLVTEHAYLRPGMYVGRFHVM